MDYGIINIIEGKVYMSKKKVSVKSKKDVKKVSIIPILGIIVALISSALFFYSDTQNILRHSITDKEELKLTLESIRIVSTFFVSVNSVIILIEWLLYKYNHKKILLTFTIVVFILSLLSFDLHVIKALLVSVTVSAYYCIKILKKES